MSDQSGNEADIRNKENKDGDSLAERKKWKTVWILNRKPMIGKPNRPKPLIPIRSRRIRNAGAGTEDL